MVGFQCQSGPSEPQMNIIKPASQETPESQFSALAKDWRCQWTQDPGQVSPEIRYQKHSCATSSKKTPAIWWFIHVRTCFYHHWGMAFPTAGALRQDRYRSLLSEKAGYDVWNDKVRCGTTEGGETRAAKLRDSSKIELYNMIIFTYVYIQICVCVLYWLICIWCINIIMNHFVRYGWIMLNIR